MTLQEKLAAGLDQQGITVDAAAQQKLLDYLDLLHRWNKVHNLTAVRDPQEMVTLHLLDSLSVMHHIHPGRLLDVGSGAGLPGIPLAIVCPELDVTVMDSNHKKASFMRQAKATLALDNLTVLCGRVEESPSGQPYDMIISRAFSEIALFLKLTRHLLASHGVWLAMKGVFPSEELAALSGIASEVLPLQVAGLDAQRHLVILKAV